MACDKITIDYNDLEPINIGRSSPFRYKNLFLKFEELPDWKFFHNALDNRQKFEFKPDKIYIEKKAVFIAKSLGVYTPEAKIINIKLTNGSKKFKTCALTREWLDTSRYKFYQDFDEAKIDLPMICRRIDFNYIIWCDFILGNWNRNMTNLCLELRNDTLIPIDYDSAFTFDNMPIDKHGLRLLFQEFLFEPDKTGVLTIPNIIIRKVYENIKKATNFSYLNSIDERLSERLLNLDYVLKTFSFFD